MIVQAGNIKSISKTITHGSCGKIDSTGADTGRILPVTYILKEMNHLVSTFSPLGRNLVTNTPHYHRRIIAPLMEHAQHITLSPGHALDVRLLIKPSVIAILTLCHIPLVERLHHHHESHLITKANQIRIRHIVSRTDGITTHILEEGKLMTKSRNIYRCTQRSKVMVIAHTLKLGWLAVQIESLLRNKLHATDSESGVVDIKHLISILKRSTGIVQVRGLGRPQLRILNNQSLFDRTTCQIFHLTCVLCSHLSVRSIDDRIEGQQPISCILHLHLQGNTRKVILDMGSSDLSPPHRNINLTCSKNMYISIKSCTRIPARRTRTIFQTYSESVVFSICCQMVCDIHMERTIAVRPEDHFLTIDIDMSLTHCSVKDQGRATGLRRIESSSIPTHALIRKSTCTACLPSFLCLAVFYHSLILQVIVTAERAIDRPIVRHGHILPGSVVINYGLSVFSITTMEFPVLFKQHFASLCISSKGSKY